ncbi:MAG: hypothetical protein ACE14U_04465 [Candidatus Velamenicoccus archaeovorus]
MKNFAKQLLLIGLGVLVLAGGCFCFSQAGLAAGDEEELSSAPGRSGRAGDLREKADRLRREDPEKFHQLVRDRAQALRGKLRDLKEKDPQKYEQVVARIRQMKIERLRRLKTEDPEKFSRIMERRRQAVDKRLSRLKETDPQKYEKVVAFKEKLGHLQELRQEDPEAFREFLEKHPRLKERLTSGRRGHGAPGPREPQRKAAEYDDVR